MPASAPIARRRLDAIDTLRGLVMILMALDHVRDFFGTPGISPTNLAQTTVALFGTRWITHLCAPGWSMIALAALIWLPVPLIAAIALAMIAGHNLFDTVQSANPLWVILHRQFFVANGWH